MKYLIILALALCACTPQFHINKAQKHTNKAIEKGATFTAKTDTIHDTLTLERTFTRNDTVFVERVSTIEKVVYERGEIRYITRQDKRRTHREDKKKSKRKYKLSKQDRKINKVKARKSKKSFGLWKIILILGAIILSILLWKKLNR